MDSRLIKDPKDIGGDDIFIINEKLSVANAVLARPPSKGGSPFIYAFSCTKDHILEDIKLPIFVDENGKEEYFYTAATDGKKYFWHPEMIKRLNPVELSIILCHETYHIVLQHTDSERVYGKNQKVWAIAIDYVVNAMIEHDFRQSGRITSQNYKGYKHPLWKDGLGEPMYFDDVIKSIKNAKDELKNIKNGKSVKHKKPVKPELKDIKIYADYSLYGLGAEQIYDKLMEELKDLSDSIVNIIVKSLDGNPMDDHQEINISRSKLLQEIVEAVTQAKQLDQAGYIPTAVQDKLLQLQDPKLSWQDIIRIALQAKRQEKGQTNDWSRFRRRNISMGIYSPRKKDQFVRWLAMLDTSGSMSNEDMTYGVSQLKCLDGRSEGIVVPCDAQTYWDKAVKISSMQDLPTINTVGRGGTAFSSFFENYKKELGDKFDVIIIMTDGGVWDLNKLMSPNIETVWVLTNNYEAFNPPFGRVAPMRRF